MGEDEAEVNTSGGSGWLVENISNQRETLQDPLMAYLGSSLKGLNFRDFKLRLPNLTEREILLACLYNKVTLEQSIWTKQPNLPPELQQRLSEYIHKGSEIVARSILKQEFTNEDLSELVQAQKNMEDAALSLGISKRREVDSVEPEAFILGFKEVLEEAKQKGVLKHPLLIVGLSTHGNIPAYFAREILSSDNPKLALIKPTSRDQEEGVRIFTDDERVLEGETPESILVVDDTVDKGGSMQQALNYLKSRYPEKQVLVMVGSAREKPFLAEIEGMNYETTTLKGGKIYTKPVIFRSNYSEEESQK